MFTFITGKVPRKVTRAFLLIVTVVVLTSFNIGFHSRYVLRVEFSDEDYGLDENIIQHFNNDSSASRLHNRSDDAANSFRSWLHEQEKRTTLVRDVCRTYNNRTRSKPDDYENILRNTRKLNNLWVSDRHKVIYCSLPKVACSSWRLLFLQLSGYLDPAEKIKKDYWVHNFTLLEQNGLVRLNKYPHSQAKRILETYTKFVVVRHPYSRLHSAFTEKFIGLWKGKPNPVYPAHYGTRIVKRYWKNPTQEALNTGLNITFSDFVRYLGDRNLTLIKKMDQHWAPFYWYCFPCQAHYDYVLKLETMKDDSEHFLERVIGTSLRLNTLNDFKHTDLTAYKHVPERYMSNLWDVYQEDFKLFNYSWPR